MYFFYYYQHHIYNTFNSVFFPENNDNIIHDDNDIEIFLTKGSKIILPYKKRLYLHFLFQYAQLPENQDIALNIINNIKNYTYSYPEYYSTAITIVYIKYNQNAIINERYEKRNAIIDLSKYEEIYNNAICIDGNNSFALISSVEFILKYKEVFIILFRIWIIQHQNYVYQDVKKH